MTHDLLTQLAEYGTYSDERQGTVSADDVTDAVMPLPMPTPPTRPRHGWLIAAAAAALVLVLVGGLGLLAQRNDPAADAPVVDQVEPETPPVIDPPATTVPLVVDPVEPDEPTADHDADANTEGLLQDLPPGAEFGTLDTPVGQAEWVHLTGDGTTFPIYGEVVEWPSGFAILEPLNPFNGDRSIRLWVSPDGITWHVEPLPNPAAAGPASLTLVDGVYWLISLGPVSIWRSTDGDNWDQYDLGDVIRGPVGLNWDMNHTRPVTIADQTLTYANLESDFPYADYAPNLTEDGRICDHVRLAQLAPDRFQVVEDFGDGPDCPEQPVLRMIETDTGLQVINNDTGNELGEILGADLTDMAHVTEESGFETLLIINDGGITSAEVPWSGSANGVKLFRVEDAVYAFIDDDDHFTVWRTDDGRNWVDVGPLSFVEAAESIGYLRLAALSGGRLVAWNSDIPNTAWETTDGLNWQTVDLAPLPAGGDRQTNPVPLDSGWFANAGWKGDFDDGDRWWMQTGDRWYSLAELGIDESSDYGVSVTAIGDTTFFLANEGRDMWILRVDETG